MKEEDEDKDDDADAGDYVQQCNRFPRHRTHALEGRRYGPRAARGTRGCEKRGRGGVFARVRPAADTDAEADAVPESGPAPTTTTKE